MTNPGISNFLDTFKYHRKLTRDLLYSLSQEQLALKPISKAGSFGKQFRHLLDIERRYVESLNNGSLTFFRSHIDHSMEIDRERLIKEIDLEDRKLEKIFESMKPQKSMEKCEELFKKTVPPKSGYTIVIELKLMSLIKSIVDDTTQLRNLIWPRESKAFNEEALKIFRRERGKYLQNLFI